MKPINDLGRFTVSTIQAALIYAELERATLKYGAMRSAHEGYGVILEELDELWDEIKKKEPSKIRMREEAMQIAAMALRFIMDVTMEETK